MSRYKQVRIMAISSKDQDFLTKEAVFEYFERVIPSKGYTYYLKKQRFVCEDSTLIYFQYMSRIIARAVSNRVIIVEGKYRYLPIEPESIRTSDAEVFTKELGVNWWRGGNKNHAELLVKSVRRGPLYIDPEDYRIINKKCF